MPNFFLIVCIHGKKANVKVFSRYIYGKYLVVIFMARICRCSVGTNFTGAIEFVN